jgi:hypothetical protein
MALNKRGIPTATGRGIWEPAQVQRMMERLKSSAWQSISLRSDLRKYMRSILLRDTM